MVACPPASDWKNYLGPIATIIAAVVAAGVTIVFQWQQIRIARGRERIALFEKRYAKLTDAKDLIERTILGEGEPNRVAADQIRMLNVSLDEGRFLLSPETAAFLRRIVETCEDMITSRDLAEDIDPNDSAAWKDHGEKAARRQAYLRALYKKLPEQFERDLRIEGI